MPGLLLSYFASLYLTSYKFLIVLYRPYFPQIYMQLWSKSVA